MGLKGQSSKYDMIQQHVHVHGHTHKHMHLYPQR